MVTHSRTCGGIDAALSGGGPLEALLCGGCGGAMEGGGGGKGTSSAGGMGGLRKDTAIW